MTMLRVRTIAAPSKSVSSADESDATLLQRFVSQHNEAAFESLMRRHGPMVIGVCRRVLNNHQEAEDACQATFLLLVQKGASIRRPERLASWLYGVAYRVAARARAKAAQCGRCDMHFTDLPVPDGNAEVAWCELRAVLDEEMSRLPEQHRLPLILCYLEGKTQAEAAQQLGWSSGSMSRRLSQARETLRRRLTRRGLSFTATLFALALSETSAETTLSAALLDSTSHAAMAMVSDKAAVAEVVAPSVAEQIADMNRWTFLRRLAVLLLLLLLLGITRKTPGVFDNLAPLRAVPEALSEHEADSRQGTNAEMTIHALPRTLSVDDRAGGKSQLLQSVSSGSPNSSCH